MSKPSSKHELDVPPSDDATMAGHSTVPTPVVPSPPMHASITCSDAAADVSTTGCAPSFHIPIVAAAAKDLAPGQTIGDFELLAVLGRGGFATVYLARQLSLGRQIALKVSMHRCAEAHTLAVLEHDHIVRVFSENVDARTGLRLLCMQYVNGTTLEQVIQALADRRRRPLRGRDLVEAIDALCTRAALFDPAALHDRDQLLHADFGDAVCWLGARLAEALAHAHRQGVLHRDIKPANILLSCYGRPLLADFNIALDPEHSRGKVGPMFGGTVRYMAPEHLDALNPDDATTPEAVDERSDIYALGLVLFELLTGRHPFRSPGRETPLGERLRGMAVERRREPPPLAEGPEILQRILRRCLEPNPARRYSCAQQVARALDGCRQHARALREVPSGGMPTRFVQAHPFAVGLALIFLPHVLGSAVNITYNALRIVGKLSAAQQALFQQLVLGYNAVVYSICLAILYWQIAPIYRAWRRLSEGTNDPMPLNALRRHVLRLPLWTIALSCAGWLPGGLFFPLILDWRQGPIPDEVFEHFLVSFTVSGLIALTYSVFVIQFLALCVFYPRFWDDAQTLHRTASAELRPLRRWIQSFQLLAGLIPLVGAVLMVGVGPEDFSPAGYQTFRVLVTFLIALGMAGFGAALIAGQRLGQTVRAWLAADLQA